MKNVLPRSNGGFTIIEILVTMVIMGLIFGLGYANFRDFSRRQQLIGVAGSLKGDLRLIQSKASAGEKPGGCTGNLSGYGLRVSSTSYEITAICSGGSPVSIKTVNLNGVTMTISPLSPNLITFKVLGQGTDIAAGGKVEITLTQTGTNNIQVVTVTSGGEIK